MHSGEVSKKAFPPSFIIWHVDSINSTDFSSKGVDIVSKLLFLAVSNKILNSSLIFFIFKAFKKELKKSGGAKKKKAPAPKPVEVEEEEEEKEKDEDDGGGAGGGGLLVLGLSLIHI